MSIDHCTLYSLFEQAALQFPKLIAVEEESTGKQFTYEQILKESRILAAEIDNEMNGSMTLPDDVPNQLVCILMDRSCRAIVAMLAVLSLGAAYVPIDPSFPEDRQLHILSHSRCPVAVVEKRFVEKFEQMTGDDVQIPKLIVVEEETLNRTDRAVSRKPISPFENKLAYVLYTSGSTVSSHD